MSSSPHPYIAADTVMREFTLRAVVVVAILGLVFGASSLYLVLKVSTAGRPAFPPSKQPSTQTSGR